MTPTSNRHATRSRTRATSRRLALALALALPLSLATSASAEKQDPPAPGTPKGFNLPQAKQLTLDNGMKVTMVPYGKVPKVDVRLVIRTGNIDETKQQVWLSDLAMELMQQGTTDKTAKQVAAAAARMGGSISAFVTPDNTYISGRGLSEFGPQVVSLLGEVVRKPKFPASEMPRLVADLTRQISVAKSRQQSLASEKYAQLMYGEHPYGWQYPTTEQLQAYTVEQVRDFYESHMGAARAHLYIAGVFDANAMEKAVRDAFGDWAAGTSFQPNVPNLVSKRAIHLIDRPGAVQSTLNIGLPVIDPSHADYIPLQVTNALLGGSFASRITANIREDKGYTYSPRTFVSTDHRVGAWQLAADVTTNVTGPSLKEIFFEIERLRSEAPSQAELRAIQNYISGIFVIRNSSRSGIIGQLQFMALHGLPSDYLETYVDKVLAVTPAKIQEITQKYLDPSRMTIVIAGDAAKIRDQIKEYGEIIE